MLRANKELAEVIVVEETPQTPKRLGSHALEDSSM